MNIQRTIYATGICLFAMTVSANHKPDEPLYKDPSVSIEKRVDDLMGRMTLHEKVLQL